MKRPSALKVTTFVLFGILIAACCALGAWIGMMFYDAAVKPSAWETHTPTLRCAYYPEYDLSLLYAHLTDESPRSLASGFYEGDVCQDFIEPVP